MSAQLQIQDDAGLPIAANNFGVIEDGDSSETLFKLVNIGADIAGSVILFLNRIGNNDGIDFISIALDSSGSPGAYTSAPISIGTMAAGTIINFWIKITVPNTSSPLGNVRSFGVGARYQGT